MSMIFNDLKESDDDFGFGGYMSALPIQKKNNTNIEELKAYRAIGTVSEFRELKEKATAKKIEVVDEGGIVFYICPTCGKANANSKLKTEPRYCKGCGQKLDWSEGKE